MTEIFKNISPQTREYAEVAWECALMFDNPIDMAKFLNAVTNYYMVTGTQEEVDFLRFYFNIQMEMMNK